MIQLCTCDEALCATCGHWFGGHDTDPTWHRQCHHREDVRGGELLEMMTVWCPCDGFSDALADQGHRVLISTPPRG